MNKHSSKLVLFGGIALIAVLNLFFFWIGPTEILDRLGTNQAYLTVFLIGAIGGVSAFTSSIFYTTVFGFAAGGLNPFLLGLVGGIALFISDSVFFYLISLGKRVTENSYGRIFKKIESFVARAPKQLVLLFVFLYLGFTPFPNDILILALVLGGYTYRSVAPIMLVATIVLITIFAHTGGLFLI